MSAQQTSISLTCTLTQIFLVYNIDLPTKSKHVLVFLPQKFAFCLPGKTRKVFKTSSNLDPRQRCERYGSILDFTLQTALQYKISLKTGMQSS